ncbi:MAG TPA: glycosyltransferase family 87 protein [Blastocatellia bacterium]|nr:glycosyltransferase family 87 protein [Blastocatellia bacterium]
MSSFTTHRRLISQAMIAVVALMGLWQIFVNSFGLHPLLVRRKDFIQEYLLAKAVLTRTEPYRPLPEMAAALLNFPPDEMIPHPATHPPPMAVISLPLALLTYSQAAAVWFVLEIVFVGISCYLLLRWWGVLPLPVRVATATMMAFVWSPLGDEVLVGQLNTLLLLLLLLAWLRLRNGKAAEGGAWLGGALIVKLMAWPIVLFLLLQKNWRAVITSGVVVVTGHLAAILLMGWESVINYYLKVAPAVPPLVRANEGNFSIWSLGWRLFEGVHCDILYSSTAPPLIESPGAARVVSFLAPLVLLGVGFRLASRASHFDHAFSILVCVSVLANPIVWSHYLVIIAIPLAVAFRALSTGGWPRRIYIVAGAIGGLLFLPRMEMLHLMALFKVSETVNLRRMVIPQVPFTAGLITLIPMIAVLGLMWLLWRLDQRKTAELSASEPQSEMCIAVE